MIRQELDLLDRLSQEQLQQEHHTSLCTIPSTSTVNGMASTMHASGMVKPTNALLGDTLAFADLSPWSRTVNSAAAGGLARRSPDFVRAQH